MNHNNEISLISVDYTAEALGIRNLSATLKKDGFNTKLIILPKDPYLSYNNTYSPSTLNTVYELVKDSMFIGVSCMSFSEGLAIQLINSLRQLSIPIVWGGINATIMPDKCINYVDIICIGEGERTIVELAKRISKKLPVNDVPGTWVKTNGQLYKNELPALIDPLDSLAFTDFDFKNEFILDQRTGEVVKATPMLMNAYLSDVSVVLARGCPHSCTYCHNNVFKNLYQGKGRWIRYNSVEYCTKYLEYLKTKLLSIKNIQVMDDNFLARPKDEIQKFAKEFRNKINVPFSIFASPKTFNEEKLEILMDAGMDKITVGVQSGSNYINQQIYRRRQENSEIIEMAKVLNKYKKRIFVRYDFLALNPYEKEEDVLETIFLMKHLPKPYYASLNELDFYPGSELTNKAIEDGLIHKNGKITTFNIVIEEGLIRLKNNFRGNKNRYINLIYCLTKGLHSRFICGVIPSNLLKFMACPFTLKIIHKLPQKLLDNCIDFMLNIFTSKYLLRNIYRFLVVGRGKLFEFEIIFLGKLRKMKVKYE